MSAPAAIASMAVTDQRRVELHDHVVRERLTAAAVPALLRLAQSWSLTDAQLAQALGGISVSTIRRWKRTPPGDLGFDGLTRASYLLGIYQSLHVILDVGNADAWALRPNDAPLFDGKTPFDVIARGGILAMDRVRVYLDAVRGGR